MAHSGRPPATPGGPSRLAAHRARPGARAARPPAPRAPRPAAGCRRESMPGASSPGARSGSALPGPRALRIRRSARVSPAARPTQKVPAALRPPARAPAPAIFINLQLPSEPEKLKGRAGAERQRETPPPPHAAAPSAAVGAPPARRAARAVLVPAGLAPARRHRRLGRSLPGAYRNLLCGVTAFRLNPASSSRLPPPPRRSRMLARCAAPPPGSGRLREDAAAHHGRRARPRSPGRGGRDRSEAAGPGLRARPGETGRRRLLALRKRSARQGLHASSPPGQRVSKVTCFLGWREEDTGYHPPVTWGRPRVFWDAVRLPKLSPCPLCDWSSPTAGPRGRAGLGVGGARLDAGRFLYPHVPYALERGL